MVEPLPGMHKALGSITTTSYARLGGTCLTSHHARSQSEEAKGFPVTERKEGRKEKKEVYSYA